MKRIILTLAVGSLSISGACLGMSSVLDSIKPGRSCAEKKIKSQVMSIKRKVVIQKIIRKIKKIRRSSRISLLTMFGGGVLARIIPKLMRLFFLKTKKKPIVLNTSIVNNVSKSVSANISTKMKFEILPKKIFYCISAHLSLFLDLCTE